MSVVLFPGHKLERHENCERQRCYICDGGLACCVTCGGAENSLPSHCPQRMMTATEIESVSDGDYDYVNGRWLIVHSRSMRTGPMDWNCRCCLPESMEGFDPA